MTRPEYMPAARARTEILGVSEMTMWRWRQDLSLGFPPGVKIRGRLYYAPSELRDWMERNRVAA